MSVWQPFNGVPPGAKRVYPCLEQSPLAFLLEPVEGVFDEAAAIEKMRQCVMAGVDLNRHWSSFDVTYLAAPGEAGSQPPSQFSAEKGRSAGQLVLCHGDLRWLPALDRWGGCLEECDSDGTTGMVLALRSRRADRFQAVDALLALKYEVDVSSSRTAEGRAREGYTPLLLMAFDGDEEAVRGLVRRGAALEARTAANSRHTPLLEAIMGARLGCVDALLEAGADADVKDGYGYNALWHAIQGRQLLVALALLDAGAKPEVVAMGSRRSLEKYCQDSDRLDVLDGIRAHRARESAQAAVAALDIGVMEGP